MSVKVRFPLRCLVLVCLFVSSQRVEADEQTSQPTAPATQPASQTLAPSDKQKLPEAGQNPLSGLDSLTIGFNFDGDVGQFHRTAVGVHLTPIVPIGLTQRLALIAILDFALKGIPDFQNASDTHWGLGDANPQFFLAINIGEFFVGPGVDLLFPTAPDAFIGAGKWQVGPGLQFDWVRKDIVAGFVLTQRFSAGGADSRPSVSKFSLQPTVFINLPKGTFLMTSPLIAKDWKQSDAWTVPVGGGLGKLVQLGNQKLNLNLQGYWNAVAPPIGPQWTVIFQTQLLFPEKGAIVPQ